MDIVIELGQESDIDELERLYNDLNDYLEQGINYPGWKKGVYPVRQNAVDGVNDKNLFVAKHNGKIIGSLILSHESVQEFDKDRREYGIGSLDAVVIYTFVIHSDYMRCGAGTALITYAVEYSRKLGVKLIRLDVYEGNMPAIRLYEKSGFKFIGTVDLGLGKFGLDWFKLFEKEL
jgi:GNAT superfamily N-acetyltransferase